MHKVLFIAYDFPPCEAIGGGLRSAKFVEYLPNFGWESTVVSHKTEKNRQTPEISPNVLRLSSSTPYSRPYEVRSYGWALKIWMEFKTKPKARFSLLYVSYPPFPQIISAVFLKRRYSIPLVIDFRDAWSLDPYYQGSKLKNIIYKTIVPVLEKWAVRNCDCLILNTPSVLDAYQKLYPDRACYMRLLPNGFDQGDFSAEMPEASSSDCLELIYCGRFGVAGRNPEILLLSIRDIINDGMKVKLSIIGNQPESVRQMIDALNLQDHVLLTEEMDHFDAIQKQLDNNVLVIYQQPSLSSLQAIAGKTYEYLRAGKAILSIAPAGDNQDIITKYAKRYEIVSDFKKESISAAIKQLYSEWESGKLKNFYPEDKDYLNKYERKNLTQELAAMFNNLTRERTQ